jgi:hypothetical protein
MGIAEELSASLKKQSKHSQYQALPDSLKPVLEGAGVEAKGRYENERLRYILGRIDIKGRSVADIGGNTGFFTFESAGAGARSVHYYDGNREHADFVKLAVAHLGLKDKITVSNEYLDFEKAGAEKYSVMLLLNVLHHVGDDFGDRAMTMENAKRSIIEKLNRLRDSADVLVFQLGFNWKGDVRRCLFEDGTKKEMMDFIRYGTAGCWEILYTGIAVKKGGAVEYEDLNEANIARDNSMGEFLNRPLFIMRSKGALHESA